MSDSDDQPWHIALSEEVDEWLQALPVKGKAQAIRALGKPQHVLYDLKYVLPSHDSDLRL